MSVAKHPGDRLVIFIGKKQASPDSVRRWCDRLVSAVHGIKKNKELKKIVASYKVTKELTAIEALRLKRFYDDGTE